MIPPDVMLPSLPLGLFWQSDVTRLRILRGGDQSLFLEIGRREDGRWMIERDGVRICFTARLDDIIHAAADEAYAACRRSRAFGGRGVV